MHTGIALVTGSEDRQWLYSGADPRHRQQHGVRLHDPGQRPPTRRPAPAPHRSWSGTSAIRRNARATCPPSGRSPAGRAGPARADRRARRRARSRRHRAFRVRDQAAQPGQRRSPRHPERDLGRRNPATPRQPLPGPRHGRAPARIPAGTVPPGHAGCTGPCGPRELAGLDPAEVARSAIESRDLAGARDIASVIDARIRQRVYPLLPQPARPLGRARAPATRPGSPGLPGRRSPR